MVFFLAHFLLLYCHRFMHRQRHGWCDQSSEYTEPSGDNKPLTFTPRTRLKRLRCRRKEHSNTPTCWSPDSRPRPREDHLRPIPTLIPTRPAHRPVARLPRAKVTNPPEALRSARVRSPVSWWRVSSSLLSWSPCSLSLVATACTASGCLLKMDALNALPAGHYSKTRETRGKTRRASLKATPPSEQQRRSLLLGLRTDRMADSLRHRRTRARYTRPLLLNNLMRHGLGTASPMLV